LMHASLLGIFQEAALYHLVLMLMHTKILYILFKLDYHKYQKGEHENLNFNPC
jgi:hypothetical protein